jgi:hypothetical protein
VTLLVYPGAWCKQGLVMGIFPYVAGGLHHPTMMAVKRPR